MTDKRLQEIATDYGAKFTWADLKPWESSMKTTHKAELLILSALQRVREEEEQEKQKPLGLPEADGNTGDATGQKWPHWIPVTEALPTETDVEVLYWDGEDVSIFMPKIGDEPQDCAAMRCECFGVTHWMKLPEAPSVVAASANQTEYE